MKTAKKLLSLFFLLTTLPLAAMEETRSLKQRFDSNINWNPSTESMYSSAEATLRDKLLEIYQLIEDILTKKAMGDNSFSWDQINNLKRNRNKIREAYEDEKGKRQEKEKKAAQPRIEAERKKQQEGAAKQRREFEERARAPRTTPLDQQSMQNVMNEYFKTNGDNPTINEALAMKQENIKGSLNYFLPFKRRNDHSYYKTNITTNQLKQLINDIQVAQINGLLSEITQNDINDLQSMLKDSEEEDIFFASRTRRK